MSARYLQTTLRNVQSVLAINARRQFQTSICRRSSDIFHVQDDADFQKQIIESKKSFLVDFHASWCGPCKILEPRLEKVLTTYNKTLKSSSDEKPITLAKVDIDNFNELSGKYDVQVVPTVLAIKNGKEIGRFTGVVDEDKILTMLDRLNR